MAHVEFDFIDGKLQILGFPNNMILNLLFTRDDTYKSFEVQASILAVEVCASAHPVLEAQVVTFTLGDSINASVTVIVPDNGYYLLTRLLYGFGIQVQAGPDLSEDDLAQKVENGAATDVPPKSTPDLESRVMQEFLNIF